MCPLARSEKTRCCTRQNSKFLTAIAAGRGHGAHRYVCDSDSASKMGEMTVSEAGTE